MRIHAVAFLASLIAIAYWLFTMQQPLIDWYEFRQTQTALTALFIKPSLQGLLSYETPVLGYPWSIPFEFPLYQWIAASLSRVTPLSLDSSGRLTSAVFGLACIAPSVGLMRLFKISPIGQSCFVLLYFTSSIYLYWNRTFMIESTALLFTLSALYFYCRARLNLAKPDLLLDKGTYLDIFLLLTSLTLGCLVKVTTALPSLALLGLDLLLQAKALFSIRLSVGSARVKIFVLCSLCVVVSLIFLKAWLGHSDHIKSLNQFGQSLTSESLKTWNYGTLAQRFSSDLWINVVIKRMFTPVGFVPGFLLIAGALTRASTSMTADARLARSFVLLSVFLAIAPLLAFTNLHVVHHYYQSANQIFLLMAVGASFSLMTSLPSRITLDTLAFTAVLLIILGNMVDFARSTKYLQYSLLKDSDKLTIARDIASSTDDSSVILVIGDDWSSAFSYHTKRRSLSLPNWQKIYKSPQDALDDASTWLGGRSLGAVITRSNINDPASDLVYPNNCTNAKQSATGEWSYRICVDS